MNDQELIDELLIRVESAPVVTDGVASIPNPIDPYIEQLIEAWTRLPTAQRRRVTTKLTDTQEIHLFQFTHRLPLRAEGMRLRSDKLGLIRLAILANVMQGCGGDFRTNIMSLGPLLGLVRPYRLLDPVWGEAWELAGPVARTRMAERYGGMEKKKTEKKGSKEEGVRKKTE